MDFEKLQIKEHLQIIRKHKKLVFLCMTAVLLPLTLLLLASKSQYQASIGLQVSDNTISHLLTADINISPDLTVANYMELLTSQGFATRVVQAIAKDSLRLDNEQPSFLQRLLSFTDNSAESSSESADLQKMAVIDLLDRMQTDHRGGNMIKVSINSAIPEKAYRFTKTIGDEFIKLNLEMIQKRIEVLNGFYRNQLDASYQRLLAAEERLDEFRRANRITTANRDFERFSERLDETENKIIELSSQQKLVENHLTMLDKQLSQLAEKASTKVDMELLLPRVEELKQRLLNLENQLAAQSVFYTDKHPKIQGLKRDIAGTIQNIRNLGASAAPADTSRAANPTMVWYDLYIERLLTEIELSNLQTQKNGLEKLANDYRNRVLSAVPDQGLELVKLQHEVEVANEAYQGMARTNEKVQNLEAQKALNVNIIEPAEVPLKPMPQNRKFKMFIGLFVGLVLGIGLAYFREALDQSVKTNDDIEKKLKLAALGKVVDFNAQHKRTRKGDFVLMEEPESEAAENFRALRTNIGLTLAEFQNHRVVMVTSPGSGEGKSTVALNLATSFSLYGKKTLLLDTDFYHSTTHLRLGIKPEAGLSNWLAEEILPDTMCNQITLNGSALDFIPNGTGKITFQKLAINSKMQTLLTSLRSQYDVIIIDAPPVLPVSDPLLIAPYVDLVLMVLQSGRTEMEAARRALKVLKKATAANVGAILNRVSADEKYGPNSYFKGNQQGHRFYRAALPAPATAKK